MGGLGPGIGGLEILVIGLLALIVVGPKDLPLLLRKVGKAVGKDAAAGKATLVALLGTAEARKRADRLAADAVASLEAFGQPADPLRDVARFVVTRRT